MKRLLEALDKLEDIRTPVSLVSNEMGYTTLSTYTYLSTYFYPGGDAPLLEIRRSWEVYSERSCHSHSVVSIHFGLLGGPDYYVRDVVTNLATLDLRSCKTQTPTYVRYSMVPSGCRKTHLFCTVIDSGCPGPVELSVAGMQFFQRASCVAE